MPKNLKLKAARAEKDLTQSALAEAAGLTVDDGVVVSAEQGQVVAVGRSAAGPVDDVVPVAPTWWC